MCSAHHRLWVDWGAIAILEPFTKREDVLLADESLRPLCGY